VGGPACLAGGAESFAGVAVEVFVEQHEVAPMRIIGVPGFASVGSGGGARRRG
jgi:hypothetical protein